MPTFEGVAVYQLTIMDNILITEDLVKRFGTHTALNQVSIQIPRGSIFGLLGPNGAGKTTLLRIINQITLPDSGRVIFDGRPLQPSDVYSIGYLPEERGLYKSMKVGEQALYLAQLKGLNKTEARKRLKYWFEKFEIENWWDKKIQELSKGMAQKIQFIVTVLHRPKLLIFDEPFSGFDPINANLIKDEILQLQKEGATIIFSTHRMESVEELCEYIALIDRSRKILDGKLSDIKHRYKTHSFEIGISAGDSKKLLENLSGEYELKEADFRYPEQDTKFIIQLHEGQSKQDLLRKLNTLGELNRFVEVIPSVNDIFIQTVENHLEPHE